ncbi:MAG: hypothetical protein WCI78_16045 [Mycobacterium sp.]
MAELRSSPKLRVGSMDALVVALVACAVSATMLRNWVSGSSM